MVEALNASDVSYNTPLWDDADGRGSAPIALTPPIEQAASDYIGHAPSSDGGDFPINTTFDPSVDALNAIDRSYGAPSSDHASGLASIDAAPTIDQSEGDGISRVLSSVNDGTSTNGPLTREASSFNVSSDHPLGGDGRDLFVNDSSATDAGTAFDASSSDGDSSVFQVSSANSDSSSGSASFSLDGSISGQVDSDGAAAQPSTVSLAASEGTSADATSGYGIIINDDGGVTYVPEQLTSRVDPTAVANVPGPGTTFEANAPSTGPTTETGSPVLAHEGDLGNGLGEVQLGPTSSSSSGGSGSTTGSSGSGSFSQITTAGSGLVIDINWDSSVASAPSGFATAVDSVASYYESHFSNPITVTIDVGYGEIDGASLGSGAVGESEAYLTSVSYSSLEAALVKNANAIGDTAAAASLTATDPTHGGSFWLSTAEAKALDLTGATSSVDGYVGFSNTVSYAYNDSSGVPGGQYDFSAVVAHEFSEVMGRTMFDGLANDYTPLDLFHYSAAGVRDFSGTTTGYFSANGGVTNLGNFNTNPNGDFGDWANSVGHNAYLAAAGTGVALPVTANDLTEMNILGWDPATSGAPVVTVALAHDTGSSSTDGITSNSALIGTADANAVVTLTEGSTTLGTATANANGAWSFTPTGLAQGAQTIIASETNSADVTGSAAVSFTLDTVAPIVTAHLANDTGSSATDGITSNPALSGTADANAVVTLTEGSTVLGTTTANASGAWSFTPTGLAQGAQTITASETNAAGLSGGASVSFTLDTVAPTVTAETVSGPSISADVGTLTAAQTAILAIGLSGPVTVAGEAPSLLLNDGGVAIYNAAHSTSTSLVFDYTVKASQYANSLAVIGINQQGASVTDLAGNAASFSGAFTTFSGLQVDGSTPVATADQAHDTLDGSVSVGHVQAMAKGVLANDSDSDPSDILHVTAVDGSAAHVGQSIAGAYGTLDLKSDGSYTYTNTNPTAVAAAGGVAEDIFNYIVSNGHGGTASSTLSVLITSGNDTYKLGGSGTTIKGASGVHDVLDGSAGNEHITAGTTGAQWLVGGPGDTLTAGIGADTFIFSPHIGNETINNFNVAHDVIDLPVQEIAKFSALLADMHSAGSDTIITLDTHDSITLSHVVAHNLTVNNFHFIV